MTRGIREMLDLEEEDTVDPNEMFGEMTAQQFLDTNAEMTPDDAKDAEFGSSMDAVYKEVIGHGRSLMDLGFNMDVSRARGIFEVAATFYAHGINAKIAKRDAQLKTGKLKIEQRKMAVVEKKELGVAENETPTADVVVTVDRNEIIRQIRGSLE